MSNAAKLKKKAAEFEQKKQFDKALQLYIQILDEGDDDEGEGDVALYNRVGDLLMRQGNVGDAMTYYEKAVDLYAESGFFNNAIALCNKILRQSPGRNSVYYKLGKISAKKGFISDAKQNFLEYASRMQSSGHLDEAFRALKEFADLCPDQDDIRLMLAEQLSKKDRKKEALEQLQLLYEKFEAEGRGEDMRATVSRMRSIDPAAEPKTGSGIRNQKSSDLVFLDLTDGASQPGAPPGRGQDKSRSGPPPRRSGEARKTVPVPAEPEPDEPPMDLRLSDQGAESLAPPEAEAEDDDLLPLPPMEEPPPVVEGFESDSQRASETAAERERVTGFEPSALDDELSQALDAALPDVEPPLSGQQFAALRLSTPLNVPTLMPPEHDLALPGQLPPIGGGARSMLSLTDEMELIIPDSEDPVSSPLRSGAGSAVPLRSTSQPPFHGAAPDAPSDPLPLIGVDGGSRQAPPPSTPRSDGLTFVGGAELLDMPDLDDESEDATTPPPIVRDPASKRPSSRVHREALADETTSLAGWLHEDVEPQAGGANGSTPSGDALPDLPKTAAGHRRRSDAVSHSALARSVDALKGQVESDPSNWQLRRRLAEALLDAGEREAGVQVLEAAMVGLERSQDLEGARSVADEIIRLIPNSVRHHQKRVEYAFRTSDRSRLPQAYLELADALFRSGQADKARAVYQRVLELAPDDPRAQAALSTFGDDFIEPLDLPEPDLLEPEGPATGEDSTDVLPLVRPPQSPSAGPKAGRPGGRGVVAPSAAPTAPGRSGLRMPPPGPATLPEPLEPSDGPPDVRPIRPEPRSGKGPDAPAIAQPEQKPAGKGDPRLPGRGGRAPAPEAKPAAKAEIRPNPPGGAPRLPAKGPAAPQRPPGGLTVRPDAGAASPAAPDGIGRDYVNLGDWLRDDEGPRSLRMVVEDEKPTGDEAADFADMLRRFKQGIAENVSEEDHESHYDLGVAYKEMGLVDEAIAEFQKALRGRDRVRTYEALGQCFMEKEQFTVAATILSRALTEPGVTDDQLVGVLYLLGYASEALMRWEAAVGYYQRVFAVDIRFRDAAERLAAIERTSR